MGSLPPVGLLAIIAVSSFISGGILVWLIGYLTRNRDTPSRPSNVTPATEGDSGQPLLKVIRTDGDLSVVIQGVAYDSLREIPDSQTGRETVEALNAVLVFARDWLPSSLQEVVPESRTERGEREPRIQTPSPTPSPREKPLAAAGTSTLGDPDALLPPLMMVTEINEMVQEKLQQQPELSELSVRLTASGSGGLHIFIQQEAYESVDDIPYPRVKRLIKDAIREWEQS